MSAAIFQQVPEAPHEKAVTLLSPFLPKTSWAIQSYQEASIVPQYLRQADLAQSGAANCKFFDSQNVVESEIKSPMLTMRNFVIADKVTDEMKEYVWNHVTRLGADRLKSIDNTADELAPAETDQTENGPDRRELLDRFLELASEPDIEALRQSWVEATRPAPLPPVEPPKRKLTDDDWAKIKEDAENTRKGLEALKKRDVPNYWESDAGKRFLASGDKNVAASAAKDLPQGTPLEVPETVTRKASLIIPSSASMTSRPRSPKPEPVSKHEDKTDQYEEQVEMEKIMGYKVSLIKPYIHVYSVWRLNVTRKKS